MADTTDRAIAIAAANERLRQERETFDQRKKQDKHAFHLRMTMGWVAVVLLPIVAVGCALVLYNHAVFSDFVTSTAGVTLGVDVVGVVVSIWKAFAGTPPATLKPVTDSV